MYLIDRFWISITYVLSCLTPPLSSKGLAAWSKLQSLDLVLFITRIVQSSSRLAVGSEVQALNLPVNTQKWSDGKIVPTPTTELVG